MHTCATSPASRPSGIATIVVRFEGSRAGMNGASALPSCSRRGTARATMGSAQRRPTTRGTRKAALTNSGTPTPTVTAPSTVGVVSARRAGTAAAAHTVPSVVNAFAVARTRPGFSSTPAAPPAPRSLYDTQRVSSSWLTAAAATPTAADPPAIHALHHDPIAVERQLVAGAGDASQHRVDESADGRDLGVLEGAAERLRQIVERDAAVHPVTVAVLVDGRRLGDIVLVADLPDDLLQDVLQGDQSGRPAELVHHDRQVRGSPLEVVVD